MADITSLASTAMGAAANPLSLIPAVAQTGIGLLQSLFSGRKKNERALENQLNSNPTYQPNKGVLDYYQTALNRYNQNPYQTAQYQTATRNAQRLTSTGLNSLQDRKSALASVGKLVGIENDALQNAGVRAEQQKDQRFNQLGTATNLKAGEERRAFEINKMSPYLRRLQMQQMKTGAANSRYDAGLMNSFNGLSNVASGLSSIPNGESGFEKQVNLMNANLAKAKRGN